MSGHPTARETAMRTAAAWSVALSVALSMPARAQNARGGDTISVPVHDVHYDVTFKRSNAQERMIDVAMSMTAGANGSVVLSLPAWTPGAYEISNFARWVGGFAPTGDGKPLQWDKIDYDTWRIRT